MTKLEAVEHAKTICETKSIKSLFRKMLVVQNAIECHAFGEDTESIDARVAEGELFLFQNAVGYSKEALEIVKNWEK